MKDIHVVMLLHCPDGLEESQGFDIPSQLNKMLEAINLFSKKEGYSITLSRFDHQQFISLGMKNCKESVVSY